MSMNDTIADFLTRIRNAIRAGHEDVQTRYSSLNEKIAQVLLDEGYITDFQVMGEGIRKTIIVSVKYMDGRSVITDMQRVSRPSKRVYVGFSDIKPVMNGLGMSIMSTPSGIITDKEARRRRVGGEVICSVW